MSNRVKRELTVLEQHLTNAARKSFTDLVVCTTNGKRTGGMTVAALIPPTADMALTLRGAGPEGTDLGLWTVELDRGVCLAVGPNGESPDHTPEQIEGYVLAFEFLRTILSAEGGEARAKELGFTFRKAGNYWTLPRRITKFNSAKPEGVVANGQRDVGVGIRYVSTKSGPIAKAIVSARKTWGIVISEESGEARATARCANTAGKEKARAEREEAAKALKDSGMVKMTITVPEWFAKAVHTATAKANKDAAKPEDNGDTLVRMTGAKAPVELTEDDTSVLDRAAALQATG